MDTHDLTLSQLKRAVAIKERIEKLNRELVSILGAPAKSGPAATRKRTLSASVKKKIAAAQRARWAKIRRAKTVTRSIKPAGTAKKK